MQQLVDGLDLWTLPGLIPAVHIEILDPSEDNLPFPVDDFVVSKEVSSPLIGSRLVSRRASCGKPGGIVPRAFVISPQISNRAPAGHEPLNDGYRVPLVDYVDIVSGRKELSITFVPQPKAGRVLAAEAVEVHDGAGLDGVLADSLLGRHEGTLAAQAAVDLGLAVGAVRHVFRFLCCVKKWIKYCKG